MAKLPGVKSNILDNNLNPVAPRANLDDSVIIIGTSTDGPMYEPVAITSLDVAEDTFGSFGVGSLVRGIHEAWFASEGSPNIRGMRIGTGNQAYLNLYEQTGGSGVSAETTGRVALKLTAKYPSQNANDVSIGIDENSNVAVYNPKTAVWSTFTWDTDEDNNTVDVHNVQELADAINADTNLNTIIEAEAYPMEASFELKIKSTDAAYGITTLAGGAIRVQLSTALLAANYAVIGNTPLLYTGAATSTPNPPATAGNRIHELTKVYAVSNSGLVELDTAGLASVTVEDFLPMDGKNKSSYNTILAIKDWNQTEDYWVGPNGNPISEFYQKADNVTVGPADGALGTGTMNYDFNAYLPPDSNQMNTVTSYPEAGSVYSSLQNTRRGEARDFDFEYSTDDGSTWNVLPTGQWYCNYSGPPTVTAGSVTSTCTVYIRPGAGTMQQRAMPTTAWGFAEGTLMRASYDSCIGTLTETSTLTAAQAANSFTSYFQRGREFVFGNTCPTDMVVRYGTFQNFQIGTDVTLSDAEDGIVQFNNTNNLPGPGGSGLAASGTIVGFQYEYLPEWTNLNTNFQSLEGGTIGVDMTNAELYDELDTAYGYLKNYPVDVVVPMEAYLDATKTDYHPVTGAERTINAGFQTQLSNFLADVKEEVNETIGVIGVSAASDSTLSAVSDWVTDLSTVDYSDTLRGANMMVALENGDISVAAFEPTIQDTTTGYTYSTSGEACYAGFLASLPPQESPTNKSIPNVVATRFSLSRAQNESMIDAGTSR